MNRADAGMMQAHDNRSFFLTILPGLPDELSMQCLARIPRSQFTVCALVSKLWKRLLLDDIRQVMDIRSRLGISEHWPFVLLLGREHGRIWRTFDTAADRWRTLPPYEADAAFHSADKECFTAGRHLLVVGIKSRPVQQLQHHRLAEVCIDQVIWSFHLDTFSWSTVPNLSLKRCLFATASTGIYGYLAGGNIIASGGQVSNMVERFNSETMSWEQLPNMSFERKECSGFVMDDCFFVIGGQGRDDQYYNHGERFDPETRTWTTIWNFWPVVPRTRPGKGAPPLVAILHNELYALDADTTEVKHFNKLTHEWTPLSLVPGRAHHESGWGLGFKAVGNEVWVIGGRSPRGHPVGNIMAFRPDLVNDDTVETPWRLVTNTFNHDGFCLNCAIMKT